MINVEAQLNNITLVVAMNKGIKYVYDASELILNT